MIRGLVVFRRVESTGVIPAICFRLFSPVSACFRRFTPPPRPPLVFALPLFDAT